MFDMPVGRIMQRDVLATGPGTVVATAAKLMAARNVGAILVLEGDRLVGIFSERDALFRVLARGLDPHTTRLDEVMTPAPHTIGPELPFGSALVLMQEKGFRHLPVVEDGRAVGIISSRSAMDPELEEFTSETQRRMFWKSAGQRGRQRQQ